MLGPPAEPVALHEFRIGDEQNMLMETRESPWDHPEYGLLEPLIADRLPFKSLQAPTALQVQRVMRLRLAVALSGLGLLLMLASCVSMPEVVQIRLRVIKGYKGALKVVESPDFISRNPQKVTMFQYGNTLIAPKGFMAHAEFFNVHDVVDETGKHLPTDTESPRGVLSFRGQSFGQDGLTLYIGDK